VLSVGWHWPVLAKAMLKDNIRKCKSSEAATVINRDATRLPENTDAGFDLLFVDPPYGKGLGQMAVTCALAQGWIAQDALVVFEDNTACGPSCPSTCHKARVGIDHSFQIIWQCIVAVFVHSPNEEQIIKRIVACNVCVTVGQFIQF